IEPVIHVSVVVFRDVNDKVLTVRKRVTEKFMFYGGKPELGESALDTAIRGVKEDIGIGVELKHLNRIEEFGALADNESRDTEVVTVFTYDGDTIDPQMAAEIAERSWVSPDQPDVVLAPLLADFVFPAINSKVS